MTAADAGRRVRITEVGPRDGLQNEAANLPAARKIDFIDRLSRSGVAEIEASSFVRPDRVPQLADAEAVFAGIVRVPGVMYSALVPNARGMERALAAGVDRVAVFAAASETFSLRNTNASIDEVLVKFADVIRLADAARIPVRGYVSCAVACPYEGPVKPSKVRAVAERLLDLGAQEICLAETIGVAVPADIERLYGALDGLLAPSVTSLHLHDTRGTALACAARALDLGVRRFDASCGGLGGCPYAPGAAGNLATEDLVYFCERSGYATGVKLSSLFDAARAVAAALRRRLPGRVFNADGAAPGAGPGAVPEANPGRAAGSGPG